MHIRTDVRRSSRTDSTPLPPNEAMSPMKWLQKHCVYPPVPSRFLIRCCAFRKTRPPLREALPMTDQLSRRTFAKLAGAAALGASNVPLVAQAAHAAQE